MDKDSENREKIVVRWINNELSPEELEQFQQDPGYEEYVRIFGEVESWTMLPLNTDSSFQQLEKKRDTVKLIPWYHTNVFKVAASILLVCTLVFYATYFDSSKTVKTGVAESKDLILPDSSIVYLSSSSSLSYNEENWGEERKLSLSGIAYFDVVKGGPFEVTFSLGSVQVVGTSFEIKSFENFATVTCYDGEVSVLSGDGKRKRLRRGMGLRISGRSTSSPFAFENDNWQKEIRRFHEAPLSIVFRSLEADFDIKINAEAVDLNRTFTGAYPKSSLDSALHVISNSMQLTFNRDNNKITFENQ
ncbi:MAG: FecR domain-containing protein [Cyclobacteriaceae bacterium]